MTIKNKIFNFIHGIKRYRGKGCKNIGLRQWKGNYYLVQFDWSKPWAYETKKYFVDYGSFTNKVFKNITTHG